MIREVRDGRRLGLPAWNKTDELLVDGFRYVVLSFCWYLPLILAYLTMYILIFVLIAREPNQDLATFELSIMIMAIPIGMLISLFFMLVSGLLPGAQMVFANTDSLAQSLSPIRTVKAIWVDALHYAPIPFIRYLLNMVAMQLGVISFYILLPPALVYAMFVNANIKGQTLNVLNNNSPKRTRI